MTRMKHKVALAVSLAGLLAAGCAKRDPASVSYDIARAAFVAVCVDGRTRGSGFVVHEGGVPMIWTAAHVVLNDQSGELESGITFEQRVFFGIEDVGSVKIRAELIRADAVWDLAVFRIVGSCPVGKVRWVRETCRVGEPVFHLGNFFGDYYRHSLSVGHVSYLNRVIECSIRPVDQLNLTVCPGSSGGPVFNLAGEVVGVLVASIGYDNSTIAFMVPTRDVRRWVAIYGLREENDSASRVGAAN